MSTPFARASSNLGPWLLGVLTLLLSACGGGGESASGTEAVQGARRSTLAATVGAVFINEVNTSNWKGTADEDGDFEDWVELYNSGTQTVDLAGYGLSNKTKSPFRWVFPTGAVIQPGQHLRVWLSGKDRAVVGAPFHASFNLDNGADPLTLYAPNGTAAGQLMDSATPPLMRADSSWCRMPSGDITSPFGHCAAPTPGAANAGAFDAALLSAPTLSVSSGFYAAAQTVTMTGPAGAEIRYTLDGSEPTAGSTLYAGPVTVSSSASLRAAAFAAGRLPSLITTQQYIIDAAIATRYAGQRTVLVTLPPEDAARYNAADKAWSGHSVVEMFDTNRALAFRGEAESSVGGQEGSTHWPQLSMNVKFRDAFGTKSVKYAPWPEKPLVTTVRRFRLRNGGNDWPITHLRDQFTQSLSDISGNLYGSSTTVAMFLNGKYYAMMDLREREDETLVEANLGIDKDFVDFIADPLYNTQDIKNGGDAALANYKTLHQFVTGNSMATTANYEKAKTMMNMESYAHDMALHMYVVNLDWPNNNVHTWRTPAIDGLWNWQAHDMDQAFGLLSNSTPTTDMYSVWRNKMQGTELVLALLQNPEFRKLYINTLADQMNTTLTPAYAKARLDVMSAEMRPYVADQWASQSWTGLSQSNWEGYLVTLKGFLDARPDNHDQHTRTYFGLSARKAVTLAVNDPAMGTVQVNTVKLSRFLTSASSTWVGKYYPEVPVTLKAVPKPGYVFVGWQGDSTSTDPSLTWSPTTDASYTAVFAASSSVGAPSITAVPAQTFYTGDRVNLRVSATDPQGLPLTYTAKSLPSGLSMYSGNGRIFGQISTPGSYSTTVTVTNGKTSSTSTITWTVSNRLVGATNLPPVIAQPAAQATQAGTTGSLQILGSDPEGSSLTYSASGLPAGLTLSPTTGLISGTPTTAGTYTVQITAADAGGATASTSFIWTITPANQAPVIQAVAAQSTTVGTSVSVNLKASDPDGGALTWSATGLPTGLSLSSTGQITGTPTTAGTSAVQVTVKDPQGASASTSFTWTVTAANQPPVMQSLAAQTHRAGTSVMLALPVWDPEGGALTCSATSVPAGLTLNASTCVFSGKPTTAGTLTVVAKVTDAAGASASTSFNWTILSAVQNASFESPVLAVGSYQTGSIPGWTTSGSAFVSATNSTFTKSAPAPVDGVQVLGLQNSGRASQSMQLRPGDTLRFRATQRVNYRTGLQGIGVYVNGAQQGAMLTPASGSWTTFSVPVSVSSVANYTVELRGMYSGFLVDRTALIDAIEIVQALPYDLPNGSFEYPVLAVGSFKYAPAAPGWTFVSAAAVSTVGSAFTSGAPAPVNGNQVGVLQLTGILRQTVSVQPGDVLRLRATQRVNHNTGAQTLAVFINGVQQGSVLTPASGSWSSFDVPLSVMATGSVTLEIRGMTSGAGEDRSAFVDQVQIVR